MIRSIGPELRDESQLGCGSKYKLPTDTVSHSYSDLYSVRLRLTLIEMACWSINAAYSVMHMQMTQEACLKQDALCLPQL